MEINQTQHYLLFNNNSRGKICINLYGNLKSVLFKLQLLITVNQTMLNKKFVNALNLNAERDTNAHSLKPSTHSLSFPI